MRCNRIIKKLIDILFPPKCITCSDLLPLDCTDIFCPDCRKNWELSKNSDCPRCGQPLSKCWCCVSGDKEGYVDEEHHLVIYNNSADSVVKKLIYRVKNYNYGDVFTAIAQEMYDNMYVMLDYNELVVTAVPRSKRAKKKKGHDQSEKLARAFSAIAGIEYVDVLEHKGSEVQKRLSREDRKKNATKSYKIKNGSSAYLKGKNVILIDDVVTTGSTVIRCAHLLKMRGANRVIVFSIAKNVR